MLYDTLAPHWEIKIGKKGQSAIIPTDIKRFIQQIEFESADGMADLCRLRCVNPDSYLSDAKVFQPGNEISVYAGYSSSGLNHIGSARIVRVVPNYPQDGIPTMQVVGYSRDHEMMDTEPAQGKERIGYGNKYSDAMFKMAERYDFYANIDDAGKSKKKLIQRAGMKDYEFAKGISNITGFLFWVDADEHQNWWLNFKDPKTYKAQDEIFTFKYNFGDDGTLLTFTPELLVKGAKTNLVVVAKDAETGKLLKAEITEIEEGRVRVDTPDMDATGVFTENLKTQYPNSSAIKLYFNNYSFDVVTGKKFTGQAEVVDWALQWFRRMRENFILSRGRCIGKETLRARQTHNIDGVGTAYNGEYYFSKVKHLISDSDGYVIDFGARRVVK